MKSWQAILKVDPIPKLLCIKNAAINYFTLRDLLDNKVGSIKILWELPAVKKLFKNQKENGSWNYPTARNIPQIDYTNHCLTISEQVLLCGKHTPNRLHPISDLS